MQEGSFILLDELALSMHIHVLFLISCCDALLSTVLNSPVGQSSQMVL